MMQKQRNRQISSCYEVLSFFFYRFYFNNLFMIVIQNQHYNIIINSDKKMKNKGIKLIIVFALFLKLTLMNLYSILRVHEQELFSKKQYLTKGIACKVYEEQTTIYELKLETKIGVAFNHVFISYILSDGQMRQKHNAILDKNTSPIINVFIIDSNNLAFILQDRICIENIKNGWDRQYIQVCSGRQDHLVKFNTISNDLILFKELQDKTYLYVVIDDTYLTQFSIKGDIIKKQQPIFNLSLQYPYKSIHTYKEYICLYTDNSSTFLHCFNFNNHHTFIVHKFMSNDRIVVQQDYVIIWRKNREQQQKIDCFKLWINISQEQITTDMIQIKNEHISGQIFAYFNPLDNIWFMKVLKENLLYIMIFQIIQKEIVLYQIIVDNNRFYIYQKFNYFCKNKYIAILPYQYDQSSQLKLQIIQQTYSKQEINQLLYLLLLFSCVSLIIAASIYSIWAYRIQFQQYFRQTKYIMLRQIITIILNYAILMVSFLTFEPNNNSELGYNKQNVVLDSAYLRFLYHCLFSTALINSLHIIFVEQAVKSQFIHLLSKHGFSLRILIIFKFLVLFIKATLYSFLNIALTSFAENIQASHFQLLLPIFQLNVNKVTVFFAGIFCMLCLSAITYLIIQISKSCWYSIQFNLVLYLACNFITEHLFKTDDTSKLQLFFIYFSPLTTFQTIIESIFRVKIKYVSFMKDHHTINNLLIISIIQFIAIGILVLILIIRGIKSTHLKDIIDDKNQNKKASSIFTSFSSDFHNLSNNSTELIRGSDELLLSVFIPCKLNTYSGFEKKKVLQNIKFKGFKNQVISFIDYSNESKSVLMKILINDQKSDTQLQKDVIGQIVYAKGIKLSFCSDKNIYCQQMNSIEHLQLFLSLKQKKLNKIQKEKQIKFMLDQFNITDEQRIKQLKLLSGGTQKKLCLACAFIGNPDIVILNDPTVGLDIRFKRIFWQRINQWKKNKLIIIGTSNSQQAQAISDQIWIIKNGKQQNYLNYKSTKYFELTFDFFKQQDRSSCKQIIDKEMIESYSIKLQQQLPGIYRYIILIYNIRNPKVLRKITFLISQINYILKKNYYYYLKTRQTKFSIDQFHKYKYLLLQMGQKNIQKQNKQIFRQIFGIITQQCIKYNQIKEDYKIKENESYHDKEIRQIILSLSKNNQSAKNLYLIQIKSIIYQKVTYFNNQFLLLKQVLLISIYLFFTYVIHSIYNIDNSTDDRQFNQQRSIFYIKTVVIYCFLMLSIIVNTSIIDYDKKLLTSIGMNSTNTYLGEWIYNSCYIFSWIFITSSILVVYLLIFEHIVDNIWVFWLGSFLYIVNYTLWILSVLVCIKNRQLTILIVLVLFIIPVSIQMDIFLMKYKSTVLVLILKEILSYFIFPVSFWCLFESMVTENIEYKFIGILVAEIVIPITMLVIYKKYRQKSTNFHLLKLGQIQNMKNDSIIQTQRLTQQQFENKDAVLGFNLCKKFINQEKDKPSLRNMYFYAKRKEILTFVGHNGCGKTTLFNILSGKTNMTTGKVQIFGKKILQIDYKDVIKIGYCSQKGELFNQFTVQQNIRFIGLVKGLDQKYLVKFSIKMLRYFKLQNKEKALICQLSEGERKKLCIIISLLGFPSLLIFDEPTSSIDSQSKNKMVYLLKNYSELLNSIILITTHSITEAQNYSNRVAIIKKGHLVQTGTVLQLIKHPAQELYRLVICFKLTEFSDILEQQQRVIAHYMSQFKYVNAIKTFGLRFVYGIDLIKINIVNILQKMMNLFKEQIIDSFDLYKYDLQEVVKYNIAKDDVQRYRAREKEKEKLKQTV